MKIKKLKLLLTLMLFIFSAGVLSACGGNQYGVEFKQTSLTMSLNQEIDLNDLVNLTNCTINDISFVSSDPSVVYIAPGNKIVSRAAGGSIITAVGFNDVVLEITVEGVTAKFNRPTNLAYDETKNAVVWSKVYSGSIAATYKVKITKDNGEEQIKETNNNYYEIFDAGNYSVNVSCMGALGIEASEDSENFEFAKLSAPINLAYNDYTKKLTWQAEGAQNFRVFVNGVSSKILDKNEYEIDLKETKKYEIFVMTCSTDESANVFGATSLNRLSLTRLSAPELVVNNGNISWTGEEGVSYYELIVPGVATPVVINKNTVGAYTYSLPGMSTGSNQVKITAFGDGESEIYDSNIHYLDSETSYKEIEKLQPLELGFDSSENKLVVKNYSKEAGKQILLTVEYNSGTPITTNITSIIDENGYFGYDFNTNSGEYKFSIINGANSVTQVNSDPSNFIAVVKLSAPQNVKHAIVNENDAEKYTVTNYNIVEDDGNSGIKYVIKIVSPSSTETILSATNNEVNSLFTEVGVYKVLVNAYKENDDTNSIYYIDSSINEQLSIVRMQNVIAEDQSTNKKIVCSPLETLQGVASVSYKYEIYSLDNQETPIKSGTMVNREINYSDLTAGNYYAKVWASGTSNYNETIVLNSPVKNIVNFNVVVKLAINEELVWSANYDENNKKQYFIEIPFVANANQYELKCNNVVVRTITVSENENIKENITSCFTDVSVSDFSFEIIAKRTDNTNFVNSDPKTLLVKRPNAPETFNLTVDSYYREFISSSINEGWFAGSEVLINNKVVEENVLDSNIDSFNVKIKYIANTTNVNGCYYIDSEYSLVSFKRPNASLEISGSEISWPKEIPTKDQSFTTKLMVNEIAIPDAFVQLGAINVVQFLPYLEGTNSATVSVIHVANSIIDAEIGGEYLLTSNIESLQIEKASTNNISLKVEENTATKKVNISWVEKENATYKFDGEEAVNGVYKIDSSDLTTSTSYHNIEETIANETTIYMFTISRVVKVESLKVLSNEGISAFGNLPIGVSELICENDGESISTLANITTTKTTINAYHKAISSDSFNYFLNSEVSQFSFKRLDRLNNLNISNNIISWNREEVSNNTYNYVVTFEDESDLTENIVRSMELKDTITINLLNDLEIKQFLHTNQLLDNSQINHKYFKVRKTVGEFTAMAGNEYYLSQSESSVENKELKVLTAPTGINVTSANGDLSQTSLTIAWDSYNMPTGYTKGKFVIHISGPKEKTLYGDGHYVLASSDDILKKPGKWTVCVSVEGSGETISSPESEILSITRLEQSTNISITNDGVISWNAVEKAESYVLEYFYISNGSAVINKITSADNKFVENNGKITYEAFKNELVNDFYGDIAVSVYALGTGSSTTQNAGTLSSVTSTTFNRLEKPEVNFTSTGIEINNFEKYTSNETILVDIIIEGEIAKTEQILTRNWSYPTTFYKKDGTILDSSQANEIGFNIYVKSTAKNIVNSNVVSNNATKLADIINLRFVRDGDVETGIIKFKADNANTVGQTIITIKDVDGGVYNLVGNAVIAIDDLVLSKMGSSWEISVFAQGGIIDNKIYINGNTNKISGTKLAKPNSVKVSSDNTQVIWSEVNGGTTSYNLSVVDLNDSENNAISNRTNNQENMELYSAGEYKFMVKAIGTVSSTEIYDNIVLDSLYSDAINITKLQTINNVSVEYGFLTMAEVSGADALVAVLYTNLEGEGTEYVLQNYSLPEGFAENKYYYNQEMLSKLSEGGEYYIKFYAKATKENYISSNFATIMVGSDKNDYVKIKLFEKENNQIILSHKKDDSNVTNYTLTYATFTTNPGVNMGILLDVDGNISYTANNIYVLDQNKDAENSWSEGRHSIRYAQVGSSGFNSERLAYLTSFGETTYVTKLSKATLTVSLEELISGKLFENKLVYYGVSNATAYYVYIDNVLYGTFNKNSSNIDLTALASGDYDRVEIRAISGDVNYLASDLSLLQKDDGTAISIKKLPAPCNSTTDGTQTYGFKVVDGSFGFVPTLGQIISLYSGNIVTEPFYTSLNKALPSGYYQDYGTNYPQYFEFKFTDKQTGAVKTFKDLAYKYFYITDEILNNPLLVQMGVQGLLQTIQQKGFPSLNYNFLDFAQSLPFGEYNIQARLIGNYDGTDNIEFTSPYCDDITTYIANKPNIRIENNNHTYNLKFENVIVNTNYFSESNKPIYKLVGIKEDGSREIIRLGGEDDAPIFGISANQFNNSSETITINLTELIERGYLTNEHTKLYVFIEGNNSNVLNGLISNLIDIIVLQDVTARVERGVIKWDAQVDAIKYIITYDGTRLERAQEEGTSQYSWLCGELTENKEYELTIQAYGSTGTTASAGNTIILSGPITKMGKVIKLTKILTNLKDETIDDLKIEQGIYKWNSVSNATMYDVFTDTTESEYEVVEVPQYETTADGSEHTYFFRAVGTQNQELSEDTTVYVNSETSVGTKGKRTPAVTNLGYKNGIITWTTKESTIKFKLVFVQEGKEKITIICDADNCKHVANQDNNAWNWSFDTNAYTELSADGDYTLQIQSFYDNEVPISAGSEVYYLISQAEITTFHKFRCVDSVTVSGGQISWNYSGKTNTNFYFRLNFSYVGSEGLVEVNKYVTGINGKTSYTYDDIVFESDVGFDRDGKPNPITLVLFVEPGVYVDGNERPADTTQNAVTSISTTYTYKEDGQDKTAIYQFSKINQEDISITLTNNGQLKIDWPDASNNQDIISCKYEIMFSTSINSEKKTVIVEESEIICGEDSGLSFNIDSGYKLFFKIRVIPTVNNYISSAWSVERVIEKPNKVEGLSYNAETYTYSWNTYSIDANLKDSLKYKIKDIVGHYDESGKFVAENVYIYEAYIEDETFTPSIVGVHKVSVAVYVAGSALVSDYCESITSEFNIFETGEGTTNNPYKISSAEQFANIKLRLNKDNKNNSYYTVLKDASGELMINESGDYIVSETKTNVGKEDEIYHFIQTSHISITKDQAISGEFMGDYNGDYWSLTLNLIIETEQQDGTITKSTIINSNIYMFETIGQAGIVQNLSIKLDIADIATTGASSTMALLAYENKGTIRNIIIGKQEYGEDGYKTVNIQTSHTLRISYIAYNNYGTIEEVKNFYNTKISEKIAGQTILFASIALNQRSNANINKTKNYGNITISAYKVNMGGLVQVMNGNSTLSNSANTGNIQVYVTNNTTHEVGGLVGQVADTVADLYNCYVKCDISVYSSVNLTNSAIGGLIGKFSGDLSKLDRSYVNLTYNHNVPEGNMGVVIYALIGAFGTKSGALSYIYHNAHSNIVPDGSYSNEYTTLSHESLANEFIDVEGSTPILSWENDFDANNSWRIFA